MKKLISLTVILFIAFSCGHKQEGGHAHSHEGHSHEGHDHGGHSHDANVPEFEVAAKLTLCNDTHELFAEMSEPIAGKTTQVLVHLTKLENYKPVSHAKFNVIAYLNGKKIVISPIFKEASHGIYFGEFTLPKEGEFDFEFVLRSGNEKISFWKRKVHACDHAHGHAHSEANGITFTKEQAWEVDFGISEVEEKDFSYTVKSSGEILPARGNFQGVTAKSSGIIHFKIPSLDDGSFVKSGQTLFSISGEGLSENNIENRYALISSQYQKSKSDYNRRKILFKEKIISARVYEESKAQFKIDSSRYFNLLKEYQASGIQINAPISGNVYELSVSDGDYVQEGQTLANILNSKKMRLHVDVPQRHYSLLDEIKSVNFKVAYNNEVFSLEDLNGKLLTRGSVANQESGFVPVIFEIENCNLLAGSFVECWLLTNPIPNRVVIPKSALVEEQGNFYVYVQKDGETYEKRYINFNIADGKEVWVTQGLKAGERVVTKGTMFVKVAAAAGQVPVHSHDH